MERSDDAVEAALQEEILRSDDGRAWKAYAEWLVANGDAQGQLMRAQAVSFRHSEYETHLIDSNWAAWFGDVPPHLIDVKWDHGFVETLTLCSSEAAREALEKLLRRDLPPENWTS